MLLKSCRQLLLKYRIAHLVLQCFEVCIEGFFVVVDQLALFGQRSVIGWHDTLQLIQSFLAVFQSKVVVANDGCEEQYLFGLLVIPLCGFLLYRSQTLTHLFFFSHLLDALSLLLDESSDADGSGSQTSDEQAYWICSHDGVPCRLQSDAHFLEGVPSSLLNNSSFHHNRIASNSGCRHQEYCMVLLDPINQCREDFHRNRHGRMEVAHDWEQLLAKFDGMLTEDLLFLLKVGLDGGVLHRELLVNGYRLLESDIRRLLLLANHIHITRQSRQHRRSASAVLAHIGEDRSERINAA